MTVKELIEQLRWVKNPETVVRFPVFSPDEGGPVVWLTPTELEDIPHQKEVRLLL